METGPLFDKFNKTNKPILVCQGGGDAGKTSDILKWITIECINVAKTEATITGEDLPNLKRGVVRILVNYILSDPEIRPYVKRSIKENTYHEFINGSFIEITGFDNEQDARGSERDILFINECNSRNYLFFWQLYRKTRRRTFLDFNPTNKFWVHEKVIKGTEKMFRGKVKYFITDHRHNPFLSKEEHEGYESISDPELFQVYSRGQLGKLKGQIFNFKRTDSIPEGIPFGFGVDIGYTSDKTAIVKVWYNGRDRYYKVLLYKSENEIRDYLQANKLNISVLEYMAKLLNDNGCDRSTWVFGDHDTSYANGLRKLMIPYRMAKKGPNSIVQSISKTKECNNYYIDSPELENELETYIWQTGVDILTGDEITLNQPIDGMPDHAIAAIRYFNISYGMRVAGREDL